MTGPNPVDDLTAMMRDYINRMRERLAARMGDLPPGAVERGLSSLVVAAATLLLMFGKGNRKREGIIGAVLAYAARYLAEHAAKEGASP